MIPIFKPYMPEGLTSDLENILYSGKLSFGEKGEEFQKELSNYIGNKRLLTISSYNHALLIIISTLGLKYGDEIIASPVSCLASNQPFVTKGLKIVWADVEPDSGALSVDDVKSKITSKTKAIFHNHYCGYLGYIDEINALGAQYGIPVIDDCIEAFGSELNGNKTGNLGTDMTVFSFQTVRLPNTIDGGAITFKNEEPYQKAKLIRDYGIERKHFRNKLNEINPEQDIRLEGYGALMNEVNSLIGMRQMNDLDKLIKKQRENAVEWDILIDKTSELKKLPLSPNSSPNRWVYGTIAKDKVATIKKFRKEGFYATGVHINNNIYSVFNNKTELKGATEFINSFVALPCGWWMNKGFSL